MVSFARVSPSRLHGGQGDGGLVQIDTDERLVGNRALGHNQDLRVGGRNGYALRKPSFRRPLHGFTLVELVLWWWASMSAILAATIIPQFSASANDEKLSNLKFNLRSIRAQLEKYKEEHLGSYPPAASHTDFLNQMTCKTDRNTNLNVHGPCGPYIETGIPSNPFNNSATVTIILWQRSANGPDRQRRRLAVQSGAGLVLSQRQRILSEYRQFCQIRLRAGHPNGSI